MAFIKVKGRGLGLCFLAAVPAWYLSGLFPVVGGPVFAILIGMLLGRLISKKEALQPGLAFTSKKILQYAVILLGFGMNLKEIISRGRQSLPIIVITITAALLIAWLLSKALRIPQKAAILIGVGSAICGGSAIAAAAPAIEADDEEIAQAVSVIFLFNVIAALIFPALGGFLGLSDEGFGFFAGTAVNDTSSVTAAASAWDVLHGSNTLAVATVVKLTRTLAIIPITLFLAYRSAGQKGEGRAKVSIGRIFPQFILLFILASAVATFLPLPVLVTGMTKSLSKFLIIMAMAAIGFHTDIIKLLTRGGRPLLLGGACWIGITIVTLILQRLLGLW